jgi:hypothetical protein
VSHLRKQIRDAVVTRLASLGGVHVSRVHPVAQDALPVFLVQMGAESIAAQQFQALSRTLAVTIDVRFDGDQLDDALDALLVSIEAALNGNLGGLVVLFVPTEIDSPTLSSSGNAPLGSARITYQATYRTGLTTPEATI